MQKLNVVILAAGKGSRMKSALPKVLHKIGGLSLLQHATNAARAIKADNIHVVVGHGAGQIRTAMQGQELQFVLQEQQLGTGHAVQCALPLLDTSATALVLYGDVPLITPQTLTDLLTLAGADSMAVLTCQVRNPKGLGRIIRDEQGEIIGIVEHKDATDEQLEISEINSGILALPVFRLAQWLPQLKANNAQQEYYLTDLVTLAIGDGCKVHTLVTNKELEIQGVNTRQQLAQLERSVQTTLAENLMTNGVTLRDPSRIDIRGTVEHGIDIEIDINVIMEGSVTLGDGVVIGANCIIKNSSIGAGTVIESNCVIENSVTGAACHIGPFARIRPGSELADHVRIGNFVEIKKAIIGTGSKVNHLSYIGDASVGENVNVGAGTITCNYDGVNKFRTVLGDNVFVGSNTALVAPVTIANGATIGAGSVITQDVETGQLAIARQKQRNISGWKRPVKQGNDNQPK